MDLRSIAKAELHCHLELCFRHSTLVEMGSDIGIEVPSDADEFRKNWLITQPMADLASVLNRFLTIQKFWSSPERIERLTFEACEDAYEQGVRILELRYAPTFIQMNHEHLSFDDIHQAIVRGTERAKKLGMAIGLIGIIQRTLPLEVGEKVTEFVIANKDTFIGLDLADAEVGFDCVPFAPMFEKARKAGLHLTVHSGEEDVPEAPTFVRNAIEKLGAERIGHGIQIIKDQEMIDFVVERNIPLEICPTSNWLTNAVPSLDKNPIRKLMEKKVLVTINSDDPSIFGIDLCNEYQLLYEQYGFSQEEFDYCNDVAAAHSFISHEEKQKVWPRPIPNTK